MTGSDRNTSSADTSLRAPYAAPRDTYRDAKGAQPIAFRGATAALMPFVPREFRDSARDAGTSNAVSNTAPNVLATLESGVTEVLEVESLFAAPADAADTRSPEFSSFEATLPTDLPWIEAFAADEIEADDEWPMGEAGKRLDELTQSLTSIDASRARQEAQEAAFAQRPPEPEHAMWSDEEWIDIMPTPLPSHTSAELNTLVPPDHSQQSGHESPRDNSVTSLNAMTNSSVNASDAASLSAPGVESAARALEGLAQRVRAGQVQVPAFNSGVAEEAVLAGLLASMLGWRQ